MLVDSLRPSKLQLFVLGYHWLPLATIDVLLGNLKFLVFELLTDSLRCCTRVKKNKAEQYIIFNSGFSG